MLSEGAMTRCGSVSGGLTLLLLACAKSIRASLENSSGELCSRDQSLTPPDLVIRFASLAEKCDIREKQADALEKLVCDFQWDHHEGNNNDKSGNLEDHHSYYGSEFDDPGDDHPDVSDPGVR